MCKSVCKCVNIFESVCVMSYGSLLYKLYMSVNTCVHVHVSVLDCIRGCWPCPCLMFPEKVQVLCLSVYVVDI